MPEFVEFLLAFGVTEHPKDFNYSGFRSDMDFDHDANRLKLRALGRSGRELRLCYMLRSVERVKSPSGAEPNWPWSLRPTATYHSFDVETARSVWVIVKANKLIKDRAKSACTDQGLYQTSAEEFTEDSSDNLFESTLRTHLILCAWAGENWRWYINFVEERVQKLTRGTLTESMTLPEMPIRPPPQDRTKASFKSDADADEKVEESHASHFSFEHLQEVHYVEEKANEAMLVLQANSSVIQELRDFYIEVGDALRNTPGCTQPPPSAIPMFQRQIDITVKDIMMQQARLKMLLRLLMDRRALVSCPRIPARRS